MDWRGGGGGWEKRVCESVFFCAWKVSESVDAWKECVWRGIGGRERLEGLGGDQASVFCLCVYSSTCMGVDTSDLFVCTGMCSLFLVQNWFFLGFVTRICKAKKRMGDCVVSSLSMSKRTHSKDCVVSLLSFYLSIYIYIHILYMYIHTYIYM
jgi:hypothetical protein